MRSPEARKSLMKSFETKPVPPSKRKTSTRLSPGMVQKAKSAKVQVTRLDLRNAERGNFCP
jgi:hypothetical protein